MNNVEKQKIREAIYLCIRDNDLDKLEEILAKKELDINELDYKLNTPLPLYYAAKFSNLGAMKLLVTYGADIDEFDLRDNESCLMACSKSSNIEAVKFLISKNVDINKPNLNLTSPLMIAAYANRFEIVELLLDNGADIEHRNKWSNNLIGVLEKRKDRVDMVKFIQFKIRDLAMKSEIAYNSSKKEIIKGRKIKRISGFKI